MRDKISACVITFNEEQKIRRCLASLMWCDEIVVMDSFSTDRTVEICREFTDRVFQHPWLGYVGQRNLVRESATHPWILFLDADEEVSPGLRDEIQRRLEKDQGEFLGYEFPRLAYYLGRWIRHGEWYPDIKLRLFNKTYGRTEGEEPHDRVVVNGPVARLHHPVFHYTYDDVRDHLETLNRFSSISAQQKFIAGSRFHLADLLFRPFFRFVKGYLLRAGFLDGMPGFLIAVLNGYAAFAKYVKLWELWHREKRRTRPAPAAPEHPNA